MVESKKNRTFTVGSGDEAVVVGTRQNAVRKARELSETTWRPVRVLRSDERMEMTFRRGELLSYAWTSRSGR
ncbi:MAG: hypothetical protein R3F61_31010 [Myxococcota bacterium]